MLRSFECFEGTSLKVCSPYVSETQIGQQEEGLYNIL